MRKKKSKPLIFGFRPKNIRRSSSYSPIACPVVDIAIIIWFFFFIYYYYQQRVLTSILRTNIYIFFFFYDNRDLCEIYRTRSTRKDDFPRERSDDSPVLPQPKTIPNHVNVAVITVVHPTDRTVKRYYIYLGM